MRAELAGTDGVVSTLKEAFDDLSMLARHRFASSLTGQAIIGIQTELEHLLHSLEEKQWEMERYSLGLEWLQIGRNRPVKGVELVNAKLSQALEDKAHFSSQELKTFEVGDLYINHFIKSGSVYFKPAGTKEEPQVRVEREARILGMARHAVEGLPFCTARVAAAAFRGTGAAGMRHYASGQHINAW
eukprot:6088850-Prymnesium_polylepis.1